MLLPVRRAVSAAACVGLAYASTAGAQAPGAAPRRGATRWVFGAIGAGVGAAASSIARSGNGGTGACSSGSCITTVSTLAGGIIGYFIGTERDNLHALRYEGGRPLAPRLTSASLRGEVVALSVGDTLVVAGGSAGAELFRAGARELRPLGVRGGTLRGISATAVGPAGDAVTIGTAGGAYRYVGAAGGALVLERPARAAEAGLDRVYIAAGDAIVSVPASADSAGAWPTTRVGAGVNALAFDRERSLLWAGTDSGIVGFTARGDSLVRTGSAATRAPVRRISVQGGRLAAALGDSGVQTFAVGNAAEPRPSQRWTSGHFAYDVSLAGTRLFVASGLQGVHVLDAAGPTLRTLGLAREAGFSVALASRGGYTYVLDRAHNVLRRFESSFPTP